MRSALTSFIEIGLWIDNVIYSGIGLVYELLIKIANYEIFSQETIGEFSTRIYALLGIFMLFKLTFSLITYVVNPDDMADKSKGMAAIGKNVIISLVLILLVPYIFAEAYNLQNIILREHTLENIVFGNQNSNTDIDSAGKIIQYNLFSQFVKPNYDDIESISDCRVIYYDKDGKGTYDMATDPESGEESLTTYMLNPDCFGENNEGGPLEQLFKDADGEVYFENYKAALADQNYRLLVNNPEVYTLKVEVRENGKAVKYSVINYQFLLSTAIGVVVLLILINFCMDIAVRSIKLAFYQIIAPIPIISLCDPKSSKSGMFSKWVKACFTTYLGLFIRLVALYLAIFIITAVVKDTEFKGVATIFIIIGALIFAKELPKIITDITGIKMDGKFTLNPFKKFGNEAIGFAGTSLGKAVGRLPYAVPATFGKKLIGGIDSARHGKGFAVGWNRVHGNLYNSFYKKLDEWAPDSAEARKNERLGREEVKSMNSKWRKGVSAVNKIRNIAPDRNKPFDVLNGDENNRRYYQSVYRNRDFIDSRMRLDRKDETRKALERISDSTTRGARLDAALMAEKDNLLKYDKAVHDKFFDANGNINFDATDQNSLATATTKFIKAREDTSKAVTGMEKVHESLRKQYQKDADTEDAIKFAKYNEIDPTSGARVPWANSTPSAPAPVTVVVDDTDDDVDDDVDDNTPPAPQPQPQPTAQPQPNDIPDGMTMTDSGIVIPNNPTPQPTAQPQPQPQPDPTPQQQSTSRSSMVTDAINRRVPHYESWVAYLESIKDQFHDQDLNRIEDDIERIKNLIRELRNARDMSDVNEICSDLNRIVSNYSS